MKTKILVQSTLSQDAFYQVNKKIMKDLKDANAAILLTSLISKYSYFENRGELTEDDAFFNTKDMLGEELFLSEGTIKKLESLLEKKGYIKTYLKGLPRKKYYIINWNYISEIISTQPQNLSLRNHTNECYVTAKSAVAQPQNLLGNENKIITIENNNKGNDGETLDTLDIEVTTEKSNNRVYNFIKPENYNSKGEDLIKKLQLEGGFDTEISEIRELIAKDKFGKEEYMEYLDLIW